MGRLYIHLGVGALVWWLLAGCAESTNDAPVPNNPSAETQPFAIQDNVVGTSDVAYIDNEYWSASGRMAWMEVTPTGQHIVWSCAVDPGTGALVPPSGKGNQLGPGAPFALAVNSVDWGVSQQGPFVYAVGPDANNRFQIWRSPGASPTPTPEYLTQGDDANYGMIPSQLATDTAVALVFGRGPQPTGLATPPTSYWRYERDTTPGFAVPIADIGSSGPRWIPGQKAFVTNVLDAANQVQLARYDITTQTVTPLTTDPGNKADAFFFAAPEWGGELGLLCSINRSQFGIYRNLSGSWARVATLTPARQAPAGVTLTYISPEPLVHEGQTYFFVVVYLGPAFTSNSEVWLLSIDGSVNQRISSDAPMRRHDPEVFQQAGNTYISYYTNFTRPSQLHICKLVRP